MVLLAVNGRSTALQFKNIETLEDFTNCCRYSEPNRVGGLEILNRSADNSQESLNKERLGMPPEKNGVSWTMGAARS